MRNFHHSHKLKQLIQVEFERAVLVQFFTVSNCSLGENDLRLQASTFFVEIANCEHS